MDILMLLNIATIGGDGAGADGNQSTNPTPSTTTPPLPYQQLNTEMSEKSLQINQQQQNHQNSQNNYKPNILNIVIKNGPNSPSSNSSIEEDDDENNLQNNNQSHNINQIIIKENIIDSPTIPQRSTPPLLQKSKSHPTLSALTTIISNPSHEIFGQQNEYFHDNQQIDIQSKKFKPNINFGNGNLQNQNNHINNNNNNSNNNGNGGRFICQHVDCNYSYSHSSGRSNHYNTYHAKSCDRQCPQCDIVKKKMVTKKVKCRHEVSCNKDLSTSNRASHEKNMKMHTKCSNKCQICLENRSKTNIVKPSMYFGGSNLFFSSIDNQAPMNGYLGTSNNHQLNTSLGSIKSFSGTSNNNHNLYNNKENNYNNINHSCEGLTTLSPQNTNNNVGLVEQRDHCDESDEDNNFHTSNNHNGDDDEDEDPDHDGSEDCCSDDDSTCKMLYPQHKPNFNTIEQLVVASIDTEDKMEVTNTNYNYHHKNNSNNNQQQAIHRQLTKSSSCSSIDHHHKNKKLSKHINTSDLYTTSNNYYYQPTLIPFPQHFTHQQQQPHFQFTNSINNTAASSSSSSPNDTPSTSPRSFEELLQPQSQTQKFFPLQSIKTYPSVLSNNNSSSNLADLFVEIDSLQKNNNNNDNNNTESDKNSNIQKRKR